MIMHDALTLVQVRLGDVVMAAPNRDGQRFIYQYCQTADMKETGEVVFETKSWCPPDLSLQLIGEQLQQEVGHRPHRNFSS